MDHSKLERQLSLVRDFTFKSLMEGYVPLPFDRRTASEWTKSLPRSGQTVIYTSYMYQFGSVFKSYAELLGRFSGVRFAARFASLGSLLARPKKSELERASVVLNRIVGLLDKAGVKVAYLYDEEPYSGALLLELGLLDEFKEYGRKLFDFFGSRGIKRLVTVDPHTTNALLRLKGLVEGGPDVVSYLSLVQPTEGGGTFVMHDSCLYSRYLDMRATVRSVLGRSGVRLVEDRMVTAQDTSTCCGAPIEAVDVALSEGIAKARAAKLLSVHKDIVVACPLCYQNLSPYAESVRDVAEVIG